MTRFLWGTLTWTYCASSESAGGSESTKSTVKVLAGSEFFNEKDCKSKAAGLAKRTLVLRIGLDKSEDTNSTESAALKTF